MFLIGETVARLRISIVEYLNTAPLVWGFRNGPLKGRYDLSFTVPSRCADALRHGEADLAIIPSIEYQRMDGVVVLPGMSVAAKREVRSILVIGKKPIEQVRRMALDGSSRSSAALVRLLCEGRWHIHPEFVEAVPEPTAMLADADAALLIGDPALRVAIDFEALALDGPSGAAGKARVPVAGIETLYVYDVAHQWREMTGLPCVLAVWVARLGTVTADVVADFLASKEYGMARIPEIAEDAARKLKLPAKSLESYLRDNVNFSLDEENCAGLELYYRRCAEAGLIPRAKPIEWAASAVPFEAALGVSGRAGRA